MKYKTGTIARSARFTANTSATTKSYVVTLIVRGKTTTVDHWKVNQAGETPPTTTVTVPTTTTTKPGDPPTAIAIVASESPAIVGDVITYSMTVADVLTATQGAVYMTDNGATLPICSGPVATNQGSLSYVCDVTYTSVGSHLIVGVFLGDAVYGQSAGQLTEVVQASTTTTTTTLPKPTISVSIIANDGYGNPINGTMPLCNLNLDGSTSCGINPVFIASAIGSDGTVPPSVNAGYVFTVTGPAPVTLDISGAGWVEYHLSTVGTYDIHVTFTAGYCPSCVHLRKK